MERTFVIIKPDAVQRGLTGEILARYERKGLKIVGMKFMQVPESLARQHYAEHEGKGFFAGLLSYITSSPVVALVLEGTKAIDAVRQLNGATRPWDATPGTIRADYALEVGFNLVHGSDGPDAAAREIALWFGSDLVSWNRATDKWTVEG